jgi:hypothetical protein
MKINLYCLGFIVAFSAFSIAGCGEEAATDDSGSTISESSSEELDDEIVDDTTGVDPERFLDELEAEEWEQICTWMVDIQGGPHTLACGDGVSITIDTVESCAERSEFPHCQVGLLVACVSAQAEDLCGDAPEACDDFYTCVYGTR